MSRLHGRQDFAPGQRYLLQLFAGAARCEFWQKCVAEPERITSTYKMYLKLNFVVVLF